MTRTRVERIDALTAARELERPVVLVFSSATVPGGGWRQDGISGQEEQLCRGLARVFQAAVEAGGLGSPG